MKRYYLTILLLLFTLLPFAHAQNVCIEPMDEEDENSFNGWLPEAGDKVTLSCNRLKYRFHGLHRVKSYQCIHLERDMHEQR